MKLSSDIWLHWAAKVMPQDKTAWLDAMIAEYREIPDQNDREVFAVGCFKAAILEWAHSRKALNYMARGVGAAGLFAGCSAGIYAALNMAANPQHLTSAKIILGLCLFYMFGAVLLLTSLKGLKIYAATGLSLALLSWLYMRISNPVFDTLPPEFIRALNIESAGLMGCLFFAATFLGWLYTPHCDEI